MTSTKTYFVADYHLGHEGIIQHCNRPFSSIKEHDDYLINKTNELVHENDHLYILGDFAWRDHLSYRRRIKCKHVWLIEGNHDRMNTEAKKAFVTFEKSKEIRVDSTPYYLSHYPHFAWPNSWEAIHLYGHTHGRAEQFLNRVCGNRRSMDVGMDYLHQILNDFRPISSEEVITFLERPRPVINRFISWSLRISPRCFPGRFNEPRNPKPLLSR